MRLRIMGIVSLSAIAFVAPDTVRTQVEQARSLKWPVFV